MDTRTCQNCKTDFRIEPDDIGIYKKMDVPPPTWCPPCRMQRRIAFRNERKVFWTTSALSGKKILTLYAPSFGLTIYDDDEWRSDAWDPLEYGRDVDFSRPFLAQIFELSKVVPLPAASRINMVNSEYSGNADGLKNCYLMFNSNHTEDSAYGNGVDFSAHCYDNSHIQKGQLCYGSFWLTNCNQVHFSSRCEDSANLWFSRDCAGCSDCFGCANLRRKKYCIFNVQYSKEEYERRLADMRLSTWSGLTTHAAEAYALWGGQPYKYLQGVQNAMVSGEYITHSKNVQQSYIIREGEDIKYSQYLQVPFGKDAYDASLFGSHSELLYETTTCGWGARNVKFSYESWGEIRDAEYCMHCQHASNLFGCVGMKGSQYCILNKRYSKEEYESLVSKIKKHMDDVPYIDSLGRTYKYGEFFPAEFSPIAYPSSIAPEHFPLSKEEAVAQGFVWLDPEEREYQTTLPAADLPDDIKDADERVSKEIIACAQCGKAYRIIPDELRFLKKVGIPLARTCVDCRHAARITQRNRARFYERNCACSRTGTSYRNSVDHFHGSDPCPNDFETSYAPDRPEIVYCEACYNAETA